MEAKIQEIKVFVVGLISCLLIYLAYNFFNKNSIDYLWNLIICVPISISFIINLYILNIKSRITFKKIILNVILLFVVV